MEKVENKISLDQLQTINKHQEKVSGILNQIG